MRRNFCRLLLDETREFRFFVFGSNDGRGRKVGVRVGFGSVAQGIHVGASIFGHDSNTAPSLVPLR